MAKKPITPKPVELDAKTGTSKPVKKAAAKKPAKAKAPAKAPAARTRVKAAPVTKTGSAAVSISPADIALRAYFIAEKRYKLGLPGDSTSDWVEAERQLKAEAKAKA